MATTKPRITVTLTHRQHEVLRTISNCGGQSMSVFISEMLEMSLPTLERMAATFQKMKQSQDMQRSKLVETLDEAQAALEPIALAAVDQLDLFLGRIEAGLPGTTDAPRGALASPAEQPIAPATNRGATEPNPNLRKPTAAKVSSRSKSSGFSKTNGA